MDLLPALGSHAELAEWAASKQRLGPLFLGYLESLNWEGIEASEEGHRRMVCSVVLQHQWCLRACTLRHTS
jgi:hypothetical protein